MRVRDATALSDWRLPPDEALDSALMRERRLSRGALQLIDEPESPAIPTAVTLVFLVILAAVGVFVLASIGARRDSAFISVLLAALGATAGLAASAAVDQARSGRSEAKAGFEVGVKRSFDLVVATLGVVSLTLVLLGIAIALKVESPTLPTVVGQRRLGLRGRPFLMWTFRTRLREGQGGLRHSKLGQFLVRTSLDELPVLFNVLLGHMSLVGPLPRPPSERLLLAWPWVPTVRPGLTGPSQLAGPLSYEEQQRLDEQYEKSWSLQGDLAILVRTVAAVWKSPPRTTDETHD